MLAILAESAPPNDAEDLAGPKMVHSTPGALFVIEHGCAKAKAIHPAMGYVTGNEAGKPDSVQNQPPSLLHFM
ncbi:MAG: hypothetical protein ABSB74_04040 [Tepidisphaeraceae bacterium]